jgi:hypothetical protein
MMKKQMKRRALQILTVLVILALAGCSNGGENLIKPYSSNNNASTGGVIHAFQAKVADVSSFFQAQPLPKKLLLLVLTITLLLPTPILPVNLLSVTAAITLLI